MEEIAINDFNTRLTVSKLKIKKYSIRVLVRVNLNFFSKLLYLLAIIFATSQFKATNKILCKKLVSSRSFRVMCISFISLILYKAKLG